MHFLLFRFLLFATRQPCLLFRRTSLVREWSRDILRRLWQLSPLVSVISWSSSIRITTSPAVYRQSENHEYLVYKVSTKNHLTSSVQTVWKPDQTTWQSIHMKSPSHWLTVRKLYQTPGWSIFTKYLHEICLTQWWRISPKYPQRSPIQ